MESVVIFEDDIVFRRDFDKLWSNVEREMNDREWGVLTLHRTPRMDGILFLSRSGDEPRWCRCFTMSWPNA